MAHQDHVTELKPPGNRPQASTAEEPGPARRAPRVGDLLRDTREEHGLSQRDIADTLHIRFAYIEALEDSQYQKLPGMTYALGFLRTYAQHLDLDVEEIIRRYKEEATGGEQKPQLVFPTPVPESRVPNVAFVLAALVLVAGVYGLWFYLDGGDQVAERVPAIPERLQELVQDTPGPDGAGGEAGSGEEPAVAEAPAVAPPAAEVATAASESETPAPTAPSGEAATSSTPEATVSEPEPIVAEVAESAPATDDSLSTIAEPEPAEAVSPATVSAEPEPRPEPEPELAPAPEPQVAAAEPVASEPEPESVVPAAEPAPATEATAAPEPAPAATTATPETSRSLETSLAAAAPLAAPSQEPAALPAVSDTADDATEPDPGAVATAAIPAAPTTGGQAEVFGPPKPRIYGAGNTDARIVLKATQDSWVQVRDASEELLLTRLLRAGDSYRVPNEPGLTMLTGNAGGLVLEVDGASIGTLGPVGKVRRDIALDPAQLLGTAAPTQ